MFTLAPARIGRSTTIRLVTTQPTQFLDLTDDIRQFVAEVQMHVGIVNVQTSHTTSAIVVNELEPLLLDDFEELLEQAVPRSRPYGHDDMSRRSGVDPAEPANGHAHCRALLLPTSACLNVVEGRLALGPWQRVFLLELDGPRNREVSVVVLGESAL
jgi:secondary thiamine-phosphate synthase enzyme